MTNSLFIRDMTKTCKILSTKCVEETNSNKYNRL